MNSILDFFRKLISRAEAPEAMLPPGAETDDGIRIGPAIAAETEARHHLAVVGATGAGKTTLLRLWMQDTLPKIRQGSNQRAILYDAKQDLMPLLAGIDPHLRVITSHPLDRRGAAWDVCKDASSPSVIAEIAVTFIPEEQESQRFFPDAARHLMYGVMLSFLYRELNWTLADLIRAFSSPRLLRRVLMACPYTISLVRRYFFDKKLLANILSTVATKMMAFEPLAAAWEHAPNKFSIEEWKDQEYLLLLGNSETGRHAMNAINRCIFKRACDLTINQPNSETRRSYFVLDELSEMGRLDGLLSIAKKGRSKGACLAVAFQSVSGLQDKSMYGQHLTEEILDQIGHFALGRLGPASAKWASELVGEEEISQITINKTYGKENSTTHNEQIVKRSAVLASEFQNIPPCSLRNGLTAFYLLRTEPCAFQTTMDGYELFEKDLIPPNEIVNGFEPRDWRCELLEPWNRDRELLFAPPPAKRMGRTGQKRRPGEAGSSLLDGMADV